MHPNPAFRMEEDAARAFVAGEGFGMVVVSTPAGPAVAQVPVVPGPDGTLRFHVARTNAVAPHLDGATALFVAQGPHAYIPPHWYAAGPDEVPTWNYVSVEVEGAVRALDHAALRDQLDTLTATFESEPRWAMDQMNPKRAEAMMHAIVAFELVPTAWRGTAKLSQNKPAGIRARVAEQLADHPLGRWMRTATLGGALLLGSCGSIDDPDWLLASAKSPDGTRVARLWCPDRCDVPGKTAVTISPTMHGVPVEAGTDGFPPQGELPEDDVALIFDAGGDEGAPVAVQWTGPAELSVTAPCPAARDAASGDVVIRLRATGCKAQA